MSAKKFEKMVDDMVFKAPLPIMPIMKKVGALFKMTYSEIFAVKEFINKQKMFFSRLSFHGKNIGKRVRPVLRTRTVVKSEQRGSCTYSRPVKLFVGRF